MENKIKKIRYLTIIILVCISALIYVFKSNFKKDVLPDNKLKQQQEEIIPQGENADISDDKAEPVKTETKIHKTVQKKSVKKAKPNIQSELPYKKTEETIKIPEKEELEILKKEPISEVVEIRYMYKTNNQDNVYYRGVWYNIKTKTLEENADDENTTSINQD